MSRLVSSQVKLFYIEPSGERRLLREFPHNAVGADLIGMLCYWDAFQARSSPVTHIGYTYGEATEVREGTANSENPVLTPEEDGYYMVGSATWTNNTGEIREVTDLRLLNTSASTVKVYGTLTGLSEEVGTSAGLEVQWTLSLRRNPDGGTGTPVDYFRRACNLLIAVGDTEPIALAKFTDNNGVDVYVEVGEPISGGGATSTEVVWQVSATAPEGSETLAEIRLYNRQEPPYNLVDEQTGFSDPWPAGKQITDTIALTWTEVA